MPALLFVSSSRCPSRASWEGGQIHFHPNVDSWASPLHTCACGGIGWPWEVVSCLDDHVTSALVVRKSYNLPRDAMHNADYTATRYMSVRLFVRLSHVGILLKRLNICSNCFAIGSHTILVIPYQTVWQYPDAPPLSRTEMANEGYMKNRNFRPISRFISEMIQDRAIIFVIFYAFWPCYSQCWLPVSV